MGGSPGQCGDIAGSSGSERGLPVRGSARYTRAVHGSRIRSDLARCRAALFDLDGVLTPTVDLHRRAWAETFDRFFAMRGEAPYAESEYFASLDGRPRFDGVATLLAARGISLPWGDPDDGIGSDAGSGDGADSGPATSVTELGNRKNRMFAEILRRDGIRPYAGSLRLLDTLAATPGPDGLPIPLGVVSSSRNAEEVLRAAGIADRFQVVVDGAVAARDGLPGKPDPATFLAAAEVLGVRPGETAVFEDAESGVAAAAAGAFGLVVGVDRGAGADALRASGAEVVVVDLEELLS